MNRRMLAAWAVAGCAMVGTIAGAARTARADEPSAATEAGATTEVGAATEAGWSLRGSRAPASSPVPAIGRTSVMVFAGPAVSARFGEVSVAHLPDGVMPVFFAGAAASREVARWHGFSIELEAGFGAQIGRHRAASTPQAWGAAFLRYDRFPWNSVLRTTIAGSVGANYAARPSAIEWHGKEMTTRRWLHYLAPEVTFARPVRPNDELVLRLHHRSSAFGLFGCEACASNVLTAGLRKRF